MRKHIEKLKLAKLHKNEVLKASRFSRANLIVFAIIFASIGGYLVYSSFAAAPACTQTFTPSTIGTSPYAGNNVNTAVQNGNVNTVICLASGTYADSASSGGAIALYNAHPSGVVTIQPAPGASAVMAGEFNLNGVSNVKIDGFTGSSSAAGLIVQVAGQGNNSNIVYSNNAMTSNGVYLVGNTNANANIVIDHNTFIGFTNSPEQSRLNISNMSGCPNGVTISNNHMSGGQADGIDISGNSCGTQIAHNEIDGIIEANCGGIHCDGFQDNGGGKNTVIDSNYFHNNSDCWLMDDSSTNTVIKNNICQTASDSSYWMQFGGAQGMTLDHNTITSPKGATYGNDHNGNPSSNLTFTNNVLLSSLTQNPGQPTSGTFTNSNNISNPTFVHSPQTTIADYALAAGSAGKGGATDGSDVGVNVATIGMQRACTDATTSIFASAVTNAADGDVLCLASGSYGNWTGTNKAITIKAAEGAAPQMKISFGSGDSNFTLDGMESMGGVISAGASNITIKNSTFSSSIDIEGSMTNIVLDGNDLSYPVGPTCTGGNAKIFLSTTGSSPGSALIIRNNKIQNGDLDGIHFGGGSGVLVENNVFYNITDADVGCRGGSVVTDNSCDVDPQTGQRPPGCSDSNHTDNMQFEGGTQITLRGNLVKSGPTGPTQGITNFDGPVNGLIIENNVVDIRRPWGIELYADQNSIVRHNTVVWHADAGCDFTGIQCGQIDLTHKDTRPAGFGTHVYDNIVTSVNFNNGSTGTADHNVNGATAKYAGSTNLNSHDDYLLASDSPVGRGVGANSQGVLDGTDIGVYSIGSGTITPPPDPTPPTVSVTAPTAGATVSGSSVALSANASDNVGVSGVQFKIDGNNVGSEDTTSPYSINWDSRTATNGTHTITATARDAAGNSTTSSSISVTTNNTTSCSTSSSSWQNSSFASQTGTFTFDLDATPSAVNIDSLTGLSSGAATDFGSLAAAVRFSGSGIIEARNGGSYAAVSNLTYVAGTSYHFKLTVNVATHTYSVTATPSGGSATIIATNYAFRTEQASVTNLNNWAMISVSGSHTVCAATLNQSTGPNLADINQDGTVNITDLSLLLSSFNQTTTQCITNNTYKCDLSTPTDNTVNIFDLSILLAKWGT